MGADFILFYDKEQSIVLQREENKTTEKNYTDTSKPLSRF